MTTTNLTADEHPDPSAGFDWEDNEDFDDALERNGFSKTAKLRMGPDGAGTVEIVMHTRQRRPQCLILIECDSQITSVTVDTVSDGFDCCARWSSMVTASQIAGWRESLSEALNEIVPESRVGRRFR